MNKEENLVKDDEIDLVELFKTLCGYKIIIFLVTFLFVALGAIYVFVIATPKYEISATFENGYYKDLPASNEKKSFADIISRIETLNVKWIKSLEKIPNMDFKFNKIELMKDDKSRFNVSIFANNNEIGISKIKEILTNLKNEDEIDLKIYKKNIENKINDAIKTINILKQKELSLQNSLKMADKESSDTLQKITEFNKKLSNQNNVNLEIALASLFDLRTRIENKRLSLTNSIAENKTNIVNLETSIENLRIKILPISYSETKILSSIVTYENPAKPKKALILLISCFVGFFVSIFGVLVWDAVKNKK
ncbi:hypothetical protein [Campylobacter ureolyticus]|uniref:Cryptic autophosphorylating protein tyrosine kinase Etk n=1 Tax=Campylobacter ureolyticus TaxID=827 RepID=A0A6N2SPL3_9BACT